MEWLIGCQDMLHCLVVVVFAVRCVVGCLRLSNWWLTHCMRKRCVSICAWLITRPSPSVLSLPVATRPSCPFQVILVVILFVFFAFEPSSPLSRPSPQRSTSARPLLPSAFGTCLARTTTNDEPIPSYLELHIDITSSLWTELGVCDHDHQSEGTHASHTRVWSFLDARVGWDETDFWRMSFFWLN